VQKRRPRATRRSACPLNASVEMLGDKWSLLILRDMMLRGARTYKDFLNSSLEGIATNILADRLRRLQSNGIIASVADPRDGRRIIYTLTEKGVDLAPVLTELVLWAAKHENTGNQQLVRKIRKDKQAFLDSIQRAIRRAALGK